MKQNFRSIQNQNQGLATYFRTVVGNDLFRWTNENGYDLYGDGLRIYTTLDSRIQKYAEEALTSHMKQLQQTFDEHWEGENPWRDEDGNEIAEEGTFTRLSGATPFGPLDRRFSRESGPGAV